MDDWQKEFTAILENASLSLESFWEEMTQSVEATIEDVQQEIIGDLEQFLRSFLDREINLEVYWQQEHLDNEPWNNDPDALFSPKIDPCVNVHPACQGCVNYHGRVYAGKLLVCGMHPYGWEDSHCPDWQGQ